MAFLDFIKAIRQNDDEEKKRGGFFGTIQNSFDNVIDAGSAAVHGDFKEAGRQFGQYGGDLKKTVTGTGKFTGDVLQSIPRGVVNLGLSLKESSQDYEGKKSRLDEIKKLSEDERNKLADDQASKDPRSITLRLAKKQLGSLSDDALDKRKAELEKEQNEHLSYKASNPVTKFLIGGEDNEVAHSVQKTNADAKTFLNQQGIQGGAATVLAGIGAGVSGLLDVPTGVGSLVKGFGKGTIEKLVAEGGEDGVKQLLKNGGPKITDDVVDQLAPQIAKATSKDEVLNILSNSNKATDGLTSTPNKIKDFSDSLFTKKDTKTLAPATDILNGSDDIIDNVAKKVPQKQKITGYGEATDKLLGNIRYGSELPNPKGSFKERARQQWHDKLSPVNDFVSTVEEKLGRTLTTEENPYRLMRLYQGMPDRVQKRVSGITDVLKQSPDINSAKAIGMARQIIDRGAESIDDAGKLIKGKGSTISVDDARRVLDEQRNKLGLEGFDKASSVVDSVNKYNRGLLDDLHEASIVGDDAYKAIVDTGADYFSKFNVVDYIMKNDANRQAFATGSYNNTAQTLKKLLAESRGHSQGTLLLDPIESLVKSTDQTMRMIAKNNIWDSFNKIADDLPELVVRARDPEKIAQRITLALDNKELRPVRDGVARLMKTRGKRVRSLESTINQLEKKGLNLSLKFGGERLSDAKFAVNGLGGDLPTSQAGKVTTDFVGSLAGVSKEPSRAIESLGRSRDGLLKRADDALPENVPGSTGLRPISDFQDAVSLKKRAGKVQSKISDIVKGPVKAIDSAVNPSKLGPGDTQSFLRNLIENGAQSDINKIKKMVGNRDAKLTGLLDEIGVLKSQFDEAAGTIKQNTGKIRGELSDADVPEGFELISGFGKGLQGKLAVPKEVADVFTGKNKLERDQLTGLMSTVNGFVKRNLTSNNPTFALITNPIRDAKTFAYNAKDVKSNPLSIGKALVGGFLERTKRGDLFDRWVEAGGRSGFYADERVGENIAKDIVKDFTGKRSIKSLGVKVQPVNNAKDFVREFARVVSTPVRAPIQKGIDALHGVASVLEDAPRVAQFKASLKTGKTDAEAAFNARNVTVDFQQSGQYGQVLNAWIPFLNARAQGIIKTVEAVKSNPARAATVYAGTTAVPIAIAATLNSQFPDVLKNIPDDLRDNNFLVVFGDGKDESGNYNQVIKIPKSDVDRILGNPLENFFRFLQDDDPKGFNEVIAESLGGLLPFDIIKDGKLSGSRAVGSVLPPILKAPVESVTNKNLYFDSPLVPKSLEGLPNDEQVRADDPNTSKVERSTNPIAKFAASLFGGSPIKTENTIRNFTGNQLNNPATTIGGKLSGASSGRANSEFYKINNDVEKETNSASKKINDLISKGNYSEAQKVAKEHNDYVKQEFTPFVKRYREQITPDLEKVFLRQIINLTPRAVKQRQKYQLERQTSR